MYLEKLEIQGFKTFAQKSTLEFLMPTGGKRGVTAIVGPNGSGKSNLADAVRWVLGEQSLKLLRGKKSEDVIFSGTKMRARSGFAEVSLILNNEDGAAQIDYTEIVITRRLYRDGESEYLINGRPVRLLDIQLLLAQANFGQRTYSVIGQGMVDHILAASPQERKEFFDEAAGVKQFQIKRNHAANKLASTKDNLIQAENLLREIEPRLRSLSRQMRRLEERGPIEKECKALGRAYYGKLWNELKEHINTAESRARQIDERRVKKNQELEYLRHSLESMEAAETKSAGFLELQKEYEGLINKRDNLREKIFKLQNTLELAKLQNTKTGSVPMGRVIRDLEHIIEQQKNLLLQFDHLHKPEDIELLRRDLKRITESASNLFNDLVSPSRARMADPKLIEDQKSFEKDLDCLDRHMLTLQERIKNYTNEERDKKGQFFALQKEWSNKQGELAAIDREVSDTKIELARFETNRDALAHEIEMNLQKKVGEILVGEIPALNMPPEVAAERFRKLKTQLEIIGTIDPETIKEHNETKTRHNFLDSQINDLIKAVSDLESGISELDALIETKTEITFQILNREFEKYFKQIFDGGFASLSKTASEADEDDEIENELEDSKIKIVAQKKQYAGIEIQATPPGKRLKSINALSGGERALTSIALICAIMAANPSPFVVLDEVDAALDESNSIKFADIIDELSSQTQFIIITHNRATMHKANILYGVTIGDDGVSHILSLLLDDAKKIKSTPKINV